MVGSLVNSLLFKPPEWHHYSFANDVFRLSTTRKQQIAATHLKRPGATVTLLFSHGNAEDLNYCFSFMRRLSRGLNVNVIGFDYSGYGASTGQPSEENCYADIEAVFHYLVKDEAISPHQIVLYGRSLGSGPSCYLASKTGNEENSVGGLILHSPFSSVYRVVLNFGLTLPGEPFPNIDRIGQVQCPILIMHGTKDSVVPFDHGLALLDAAPKNFRTKPFWMRGSGHNDHGPKVEAELLRTCNKYLDYYILARRLWLNHQQPIQGRRFRVPVGFDGNAAAASQICRSSS